MFTLHVELAVVIANVVVNIERRIVCPAKLPIIVGGYIGGESGPLQLDIGAAESKRHCTQRRQG